MLAPLTGVYGEHSPATVRHRFDAKHGDGIPSIFVPLPGDTPSRSAPVGSELQSAGPSEPGAAEEKGEDLRKKLKLLKDYYEEGLITEDDYTTKKAAILGDL